MNEPPNLGKVIYSNNPEAASRLKVAVATRPELPRGFRSGAVAISSAFGGAGADKDQVERGARNLVEQWSLSLRKLNGDKVNLRANIGHSIDTFGPRVADSQQWRLAIARKLMGLG